VSELDHLFLFEQLSSPILQEREAAAREIGEGILDSRRRDSFAAAMLERANSQRSESRSSEALLPFLWARLRDTSCELPPCADVIAAIRYPSPLAALYIETLYGEPQPWRFDQMYSEAPALDERDLKRFAYAMARAPRWMQRLRHPEELADLLDDVRAQFAVVDERLMRPPLDQAEYAQSADSFIPLYESAVHEALYSGLQRAIARQFDRHAVVPEYVPYAAPVLPSLWMAPRRSAPAELASLLDAGSIEDVEVACIKLLDAEHWPARLSARTVHEDCRIIDLDVIGCYQRLEYGSLPEPEELRGVMNRGQVRIDWDTLPFEVEPGDAARVASRVRGCTVIPATLSVVPESPARWMADMLVRGVTVPFSSEPLATALVSGRDSICFTTKEGRFVGELYHWLRYPDLARPGGMLPPNAVACMLSTSLAKEAASELRCARAMIIRRRVFERDHRGYEFREEVEERLVGGTRIVIP
jgi:hypothetical protein